MRKNISFKSCKPPEDMSKQLHCCCFNCLVCGFHPFLFAISVSNGVYCIVAKRFVICNFLTKLVLVFQYRIAHSSPKPILVMLPFNLHKVRRVGNRSVLWLFTGSPTMMTSSNGTIFGVTGPLCGELTGPGEFPAQRPVTWSFGVFFDLRLNKRLSKQSSGWCFETLSWLLWRQCNADADNPSWHWCSTHSSQLIAS